MKLRILSGLLLLAGLCGFVRSNFITMEYRYSIEDKSRLYIEGTSNVNSFDCNCRDRFSKGSLTLAFMDSDKSLRFSNTMLKIRSQSLDCDNNKMNKDLYEALKSEQYPDITIQLHDAVVQSGSFSANNGEWVNVKAFVTLTITNVSRNIMMDVKGQKLGNGKFHFVSSKEILLTDYNIEPPTALLGLIKVRNNIRINLDLYTSASE